MPFHRLSVPTYFGGLPGGYDYINNATSGTPAPVDTVKGVGPNAGTYFVAFGEDGTSRHANRANNALAENTDYLDDLLHRDIAVKKVTADVLAAAPVSLIILSDPAGLWIGSAGTPNNSIGINTFVEILDSNNNEIIGDPATGARSVVTAISGGVVGSGFVAGPISLTVSPAIPAGVTYRVYYAVRGNLANLPADELTNVLLRAAQERDAGTLDFENQISRRTGINVDALIAAVFETPNGVRRPTSGVMTFGVDVDNSVGGTRIFSFVKNRNAVPNSDHMGRIVLEPGGGSLDAVNRFELGPVLIPAGIGVSSGNLRLFDLPIAIQGVFASLPQHVRISGSGSGEDYPRIADKLVYAPLLRVMSSGVVAVGDGTTSFGQINGATAISDAFAQWGGTLATGSLHIKLKAGTYTITDAARISNIGANQTVIIEGDSREACVITANVSDGNTFLMNGGRLVLKNLTLQLSSGTLGGIVLNGGSPRLEIADCSVIQQKITITNPNGKALAGNGVLPTDTDPPTLVIKDSFLDMDLVAGTAGANPNLHIIVGDNLEHRNFFIQRTTFRVANNNTPFKIEASGDGISTTRVRNVIFSDCAFLLGFATDTGTLLTANAGVCWLEPRNSVNALQVDNLVWRNCDVWANHKGAAGVAAVLLHLYTPAHDYDGGANPGKTIIGRVIIDGGDWQMPEGVNTVFVPWVVNARTLRVRNVNIKQTDGLTGAVPSNLTTYYAAAAASAWGAINFLSFLEVNSAFDPVRYFEIKNVAIRNVRRAQCSVASGVSDVLISAPTSGTAVVDGVKVWQPSETSPGGGNLPSYRMQIRGGAGRGSSPMRNIVWDGGGLTTSLAWSGIYMMTLTSSPSVFESCGVRHPSGAGSSAADGIWVGGEFIRLVNCFGYFCRDGMKVDAGTASPDIMVQGGEFSDNGRYGIFFQGYSFWNFSCAWDGVRATGNGDYGFYATAPNDAWEPGVNPFTQRSSWVHVTGSVFYNNKASSFIQCRIECSNSTNALAQVGTFIGNTVNHLLGDAGAGEVQFIKNGGAIGSELANFRGAVSDWAGGVANGVMPLNFALLRNGV